MYSIEIGSAGQPKSNPYCHTLDRCIQRCCCEPSPCCNNLCFTVQQYIERSVSCGSTSTLCPFSTGLQHIGEFGQPVQLFLCPCKRGKFILRVEDTDVSGTVMSPCRIVRHLALALASAGMKVLWWAALTVLHPKRAIRPLNSMPNSLCAMESLHCYCSRATGASAPRATDEQERGAGYDRHCRNLGESGVLSMKSKASGRNQLKFH